MGLTSVVGKKKKQLTCMVTVADTVTSDAGFTGIILTFNQHGLLWW